MGWIYSRELADCRSRSASGLNQSHIASSIPTASRYFCPKCNVAISNTLPFGMTCEHFAVSILMFRSISSTADSPVRIEVLRELAKAWKESEARFFGRSSASLEKSNRALSLSKTLGAREVMSRQCDPPFVRLSTTQERDLWRRRKLEQITGETDYGFWPTPTASNYGSNQGGSAGRKGKIRKSISGLIGGKENPAFREWLMGYHVGWTEIEPWVIAWCRSRREKRSKG